MEGNDEPSKRNPIIFPLSAIRILAVRTLLVVKGDIKVTEKVTEKRRRRGST